MRRLALFTLLIAPTAFAAGPPAAGHWEGAITLPTGPLKIAVDLAEAGGEWSGTIDIPAQGLRGFALADVSVEDKNITFKLPKIPGNPGFAGTLSEGGDTLSGDFTQGGASLKFELKRGAKAAGPEFVTGEGLAGSWQGELDAGVAKLRTVLNFEGGGDGLTGELVSVDQGGARVPLKDVTLKGRRVSFAAPAAAASFAGEMTADGSRIDGTFSQGGRKMGLSVGRLAGEAETPRRPQEPDGPLPYEARDVTFPGGGEGVTLAGTLTVPPGEGPFPAVALLTGSGPQDRDEAVMGHRPFLVLADHLTRSGVLVLRFDDRGVGESTGSFGKATVADFADDAAAAVAFLLKQPEVDASRLGLVGHSEGGLSGPMAAAETGDVKFLVLLAAPGVPMSELLVRQAADAVRTAGGDEAAAARQAEVQRRALAVVRDLEGPDDPGVAKLRAVFEESRATMPEALRDGNADAAVADAVRLATTDWFRGLVRADPRDVLRRIGVPVLALNGGKDVQVAADENLPAIAAALREGGNGDVTTRAFPDLNHLFQHAETGAVSEYATIEETFAPEVLEVISDWIAER